MEITINKGVAVMTIDQTLCNSKIHMEETIQTWEWGNKVARILSSNLAKETLSLGKECPKAKWVCKTTTKEWVREEWLNRWALAELNQASRLQ